MHSSRSPLPGDWAPSSKQFDLWLRSAACTPAQSSFEGNEREICQLSNLPNGLPLLFPRLQNHLLESRLPRL
jgi:hypothetical protein